MHLVLPRFIPAIIYFILMTALLCLPGNTFENVDQSWMEQYQLDKVIHALLFGLLVYLFCRPIRLKGHFTKAISILFFVILLLAIIYGVVIEFIQMAIPGRSFDGWDILGDTVGAYIGYRIAKNQLKKEKPVSVDELKTELVNYAKDYVGEKLGTDILSDKKK